MKKVKVGPLIRENLYPCKAVVPKPGPGVPPNGTHFGCLCHLTQPFQDFKSLVGMSRYQKSSSRYRYH